MKVLSWNVARRAKKATLQVEAVLALEADIFALQEVALCSVETITQAFAQAGISYVSHTAHLAKQNQMHFCVLVASRWPFCVLPHTSFTIPFPERLLPLRIHSSSGELDFYTVHVPPGSSNGWIKIETFQGIYQHLACPSARPRVLCGDFNSPQAETSSGQIITWGERISKSGKLTGTGSAWDQGERSVLEGLAKYDLKDTFRYLNGYELEAYSWYTNNGDKSRGRRFDHIFASQSLQPLACHYHSHLREQQLSDHAPITALFQPLPALEVH